MTRRRPSPAVQLARDVLHMQRCKSVRCERCDGVGYYISHRRVATLARALLLAVKR